MPYIAIESKEFRGYYEVPGFTRYVVTTTGAVFDRKSNDFIKCHKNPAGYYNYFLYKDDGNRTTVGRHRLLCIVFKYPGNNYHGLVANHKNGIKGDDRLDNLEWLTQKENIEHAGLNGL